MKVCPYTRPRILIIMVLVLGCAAGSIFSATTTITSLPYTANQAGTNYSETLYVAGTNLVASGSGLRINGHDIVLMLENDTITFGTDGGNGYYGLELYANSYNIKVVGGTVYHGGLGNNNVCMQFMGTNDALIENLNLRIAGTNGHCVYSPSIGPPANYNVEISGGHYRSDVTGYDNRCAYDGAALNIGTTYAGYGDFHYKLHGIRLITGPGQGLCVGGRTGGNNCLTEIYACTLQADARNLTYTSGDNTCLSAANPYQISVTRLAAGSSIHDNVITSGSTYGGCRGIIVETCAGTEENPIEIYNNYVDIHEGPNLEVPNGNVQVLRMRFGNAYVHVHDNIFIGKAGVGMGSSYGEGAVGLRLTSTDEEGHIPDYGMVIENNLFRTEGLTSGVDAKACILESFSARGNIIRNNRFESAGQILAFGGENYGADGITFDGDTLVRLTPSSDPVTVMVGWRNYFSASNDTLRDLIYEGGASEDDITLGAGGSDYRLQRTLNIVVNGNNDLPVPGATVSVVNGYGQTVISGTTDGHGNLSGVVSYRWDQSSGSDSLGYNNFTVSVSKAGDSNQQVLTVASGSADPFLVLSNTEGTDPGDLDLTPPGTIEDLAAE